MADDLFEQRPPPDGDAPPSVVLRVHLQPGAGRTMVVGRHGNALHVRVAPPPQDGRANTALVKFLAETFEVPEAAVELVGGEHGRDKRVAVTGIDAESFGRRLDDLLETAGRAPGRSGRAGPARR